MLWLAVVLLAVFLVLGILWGATVQIAWYLLSGLVIGALARWVLPGREEISIFKTALIGVAGGIAGGVMGRMLHAGQLLEFVFSVLAAAGLLTILGLRARKS